MSFYAKLKKAYKNQRLLSGLRKQLAQHDGALFLHDTHFSRVVPKNNGLLIYDCVDLPLMHQRTSQIRRSKHKYIRALIDYTARSVVKQADIITLTSPHYKNFLTHWIGKSIMPITLRNFASPEVVSLTPNTEMKKFLQLHSKVSHWIVVHNRIGEFLDIDGVLKAVNKLPQHWGLCFLGVFEGQNLKGKISIRAKQYCSKHTVVCHDALYGEEKLSALMCFDLGLVPLIAKSQNLKRCIPNRALELLAIGVPQIASRTRALNNLASVFSKVIFSPEKSGQESFEETLIKICRKLEQKTSDEADVDVPNWFKDFNGFFKVLDSEVKQRGLAKDIVILSENNPHKNSRLTNIQTSFKEQGYSSTVLEINLRTSKVIRHV